MPAPFAACCVVTDGGLCTNNATKGTARPYPNEGDRPMKASIEDFVPPIMSNKGRKKLGLAYR